MLLYHKNKIINLLIEELQKENSLAMETLLELSTCIARDLQDEFYPFFPQILIVLVKLLDPNNPKLLEKIFSTLGYLFKFLQKLLLQDIDNVFSLYYNELLGHKKDYIRIFAAESFSFLLRKLNRERLSSHIDFIFSKLQETPPNTFASSQLSDGVSNLFFETVKVSSCIF